MAENTGTKAFKNGGRLADTLSKIFNAFYSTLYADNRYRTGVKIKKPAWSDEDIKMVSQQLNFMYIVRNLST